MLPPPHAREMTQRMQDERKQEGGREKGKGGSEWRPEPASMAALSTKVEIND
jgi:hypothetical protein